MIAKEDSIELTRRARSMGMSVIAIAKLPGISRDTVYKRLKVQVQQHNRLKIHDKIQKELQNLLLKNPTHGVRGLASELGTSKSTVQRSIKTLGFTSKQLSLRFADRLKESGVEKREVFRTWARNVDEDRPLFALDECA